MANWWNNIKEKMKQYQESERAYKERLKELEKNRIEFANEIVRVYQESEEEMQKRLRKWSEPLVKENKKELLALFKLYLKTDEYHAESVAIFYQTLKEEERPSFLNEFTEEEKEIIWYQYENLRKYNEEVLEDALMAINRTVKKAHKEISERRKEHEIR